MLVNHVVRRIEHWLLDRLIPFSQNPRTYSDARIARFPEGASA